MTIGEFKKLIEEKNLPDDMPMGLLDLTTDDMDDSNYHIDKETIHIGDYVSYDEPDEIKGEMLFFTFENRLNENPI